MLAHVCRLNISFVQCYAVNLRKQAVVIYQNKTKSIINPTINNSTSTSNRDLNLPLNITQFLFALTRSKSAFDTEVFKECTIIRYRE